MQFARFFSLIVVATFCASAWAAPPNDAPPRPGIKMIEHQKMMIGDTVVYEADVNVLDASAKQYWVEIGVDEREWRVPAADRSVGSASNQSAAGVHRQGNGWMVSYLVREKQVAGTAQVDLIYTIRDASKGIDRTEHVKADVEVGKRFTATTPSGSEVWLLVTQQ